jgi:hypothetical protein
VNPYPIFYLRALPVGYGDNFQLYACTNPRFDSNDRFAYTGFSTLFVVGESSVYVSEMQPAPLSGLILTTHVTSIEAVAIIQFTITNS